MVWNRGGLYESGVMIAGIGAGIFTTSCILIFSH